MQAHTQQASVYGVHTKNTRQSRLLKRLRIQHNDDKPSSLQGLAHFMPNANTVRCSRVAIRSRSASEHAPPQAEADIDLFRWLYVKCGASPSEMKVHVADTGSPAGRGLVAKEDIMPDEVILSVR
eukprot:3137622-Pyramimonas_sp.AAC.1